MTPSNRLWPFIDGGNNAVNVLFLTRLGIFFAFTSFAQNGNTYGIMGKVLVLGVSTSLDISTSAESQEVLMISEVSLLS